MSDAAEVAEDYRLALEDLSSNMRFEISNLTVIARENTEHALTIAEVLQTHILKTAPNKKLPALYVLDSIVKNVGTPYTLYFGRNLFKTFMESYAVVDQPVRRKMEEMLRTWKEPVPGSMDSRPVFSPELVRPIENALMKARAASMPQGAIPGRPRSAIPHRDTPTPPNMRGPGAPPGAYPHQGYAQPNGGQHVPPHQQFPSQQPPYYPPHSTPQPSGSTQAPFQPPFPGVFSAPAGISIDTLNKDIQNLIVVMRAESSQKPHDISVQSKLRALVDLQGILQTTSLPPEQLELIKKQVTELAADVNMRVPSSAPNTASSTPTPAPPPMSVASSVNLPQVPVPAPAAPAQGAVTIDSLLGQGALAALLARQSTTPQNSTPNQPPPYANVVIRSPPPAPAAQPEPPKPTPVTAPVAPPPENPMDLLARLRAAGMLPAVTPTNSGATAPPPLSQQQQPPPAPVPAPAPAASIIPPNIASILSATKAMGIPGFISPSVGCINAASLRQPFQPNLLSGLYDELGPPCSQCGRRFKTDEEGRKKKTAHMDWHFRVHQRSNEAEKRGTHRSWYVDQRDWLNSREVVDSDHIPAPEEAVGGQASKDSEAAKPKYILVPDPSLGVNNVCPICQDKFENKWLDTVQEWVWLDAVLVGNRAYHASCHAEATQDRESTPGYRRTPEPVLGKRKAEVSIASPKVRSLKTSA